MKNLSAIARTIFIALVVVAVGSISSVIGYAGLQYGDTRWVTVASTERALLREYRLDYLDLEYLQKNGIITERQQLKKDQLEIDIEELKEQLGK